MRRDNEHEWHVKQFTRGRRWQHPLVSSCRAALHSFAALALAVGADVVEVHQDWVATALVAWPEAKAKVVDVAGAESLHQSTPRERPRAKQWWTVFFQKRRVCVVEHMPDHVAALLVPGCCIEISTGGIDAFANDDCTNHEQNVCIYAFPLLGTVIDGNANDANILSLPGR